jgi:putative transcriptional regulator
MRKRKNEMIERLLRLSRELHACGAFGDEGVQRIEHAGIAAPEPLTPDDFRIIREQSDYSVYTLARLFNIPARRYRRWEQGLARGPQGIELRLLRMVRDRGVASVFP